MPIARPAAGRSDLPRDWQEALGAPDLDAVLAAVAREREAHAVYPTPDEVFSAFALTPFAAVRVVLLGQDPYHGPGQAHGLAFSVRPPTRPPPSLKNVFRELSDDLGLPTPTSGDLSPWARQGVLLLNTALTVRAREAGSHRGIGWEPFTDGVVRALSARRDGLVFLLWGKAAQEKAALVDRSRHRVLAAAHPSPYSASAGFFGSRPFSSTNRWFDERGEPPVDWRLGA